MVAIVKAGKFTQLLENSSLVFASSLNYQGNTEEVSSCSLSYKSNAISPHSYVQGKLFMQEDLMRLAMAALTMPSKKLIILVNCQINQF